MLNKMGNPKSAECWALAPTRILSTTHVSAFEPLRAHTLHRRPRPRLPPRLRLLMTSPYLWRRARHLPSSAGSLSDAVLDVLAHLQDTTQTAKISMTNSSTSGSTLTSRQALSARTSNLLRLRSECFNFLPRQDTKHNNMVWPLLKALVGSTQGCRVHPPPVDFRPPRARRYALPPVPERVLERRHSLPQRRRVLRKLFARLTQDALQRRLRVLRPRGRHYARLLRTVLAGFRGAFHNDALPVRDI